MRALGDSGCCSIRGTLLSCSCRSDAVVICLPSRGLPEYMHLWDLKLVLRSWTCKYRTYGASSYSTSGHTSRCFLHRTHPPVRCMLFTISYHLDTYAVPAPRLAESQLLIEYLYVSGGHSSARSGVMCFSVSVEDRSMLGRQRINVADRTKCSAVASSRGCSGRSF
ncbi:hypothetical protein OE88DRAFT_1650467 [Heliocybe sulcata]|uniref:Uncharacterized protein n=1 Tax=Heliocybe sulcata TaxID=5364 RepID=A0A5C3NKE9_9AGAM|nr:hypothetical protein OE88DRAFT_1650467 [Heliocybe sulcata]